MAELMQKRLTNKAADDILYMLQIESECLYKGVRQWSNILFYGN